MPELLLETDSWFHVDADIYYARLLGFEDEIVRDGMALRRAEPQILMPIPMSFKVMTSEVLDEKFAHDNGIRLDIAPMKTAVYVLQSCFVTLDVSGETYEVPVDKLRNDFTVKVAYLRYRRRS